MRCSVLELDLSLSFGAEANVAPTLAPMTLRAFTSCKFDNIVEDVSDEHSVHCKFHDVEHV